MRDNIKRLFDIVASGCELLVLSPLSVIDLILSAFLTTVITLRMESRILPESFMTDFLKSLE